LTFTSSSFRINLWVSCYYTPILHPTPVAGTRSDTSCPILATRIARREEACQAHARLPPFRPQQRSVGEEGQRTAALLRPVERSPNGLGPVRWSDTRGVKRASASRVETEKRTRLPPAGQA
jgi:hypothetical protein